MNRSLHEESEWFRALTLIERVVSLRAGEDALRSGQGFDTERAVRSVEEWRSTPPFLSASPFEERLALDGIREDELFRILGEPIDALRARTSAPGWLTQISDSFLHGRPPSVAGEMRQSGDNALLAFLEPLDPLIAEARERLRRGIDRLPASVDTAPFDRGTIEQVLFAGLPGRLIRSVSRTMALELNVARLVDRLEGETPEARFRSFIDRLSAGDSALDMLREYPVLAREIALSLNQWVEFSLEFLGHLCADWTDLRSLFAGDRDPGVLEEIEGGVGDSHRHGRSVRIARFSSGLRLVYKPKPMAADRHFQELLAFLNEREEGPDGEWFRIVKVFDRGSYGWTEFVEHNSCDTPDQVGRFYQRQGAYLALLYAVEAVDFHFENLVASGEHPVLIDLEALFHPRIQSGRDRGAAGLAARKLEHSVMRVGLLPWRFLASEESEGWEVGGLSSSEGQLTPVEMPFWVDPATDAMRLSRRRVPLSPSRNRPAVKGRPVELPDYADEIMDGFKRMYLLLGRVREELLAADGPISRFIDDEVRVILRPTMQYAMLLDEGFHPDVLRDALDRERLFDRLWIAAERMPHLRRVLRAEREDLLRGDVPSFASTPGSRDLWTSAGERIPQYFEESGMSLVRSRLGRFNAEDLEQQLWFVRASLATQPPPAGRARSSEFSRRKPERLVEPDGLLGAARAVGDRLEALALKGGQDVTWIGLNAVRHQFASVAVLDLDLYDGLPGVAMFLAHLAAATGEERYLGLAEGALMALRRQVEESRPFLKSVGGFSGWGGVIYALTHLGVVLDRPDLFGDAEAIVRLLPPLIEKDKMLDVIAGAAGCIFGLLALQSCAPSRGTLDAAALCGERLLAAAQAEGDGIGWVTRCATRPLTGFSHGAAGFTAALLELAAATGDQRFQRAALASLAYENGQFSPELQNWRDFRDLTDSGRPLEGVQTGQSSWCHGAMGIGLSRLRSLRYVHHEALRADIEIAIGTTLDHGFGMSHCLCHGDCGNLELFLQAGLPSHLNQLTGAVLDDIAKDGWRCGHPLKVESPGLMTGLAGIGYQFLRLRQPEKVPSVLVLEPPALPLGDATSEDRYAGAA